MSALVTAAGPTGRNLAATIQKVDAAGSLGDYWNQSSDAFEAAPVWADKAITLTEGTAENAGSYTGGESADLGGYTGWAVIRLHDTDNSNIAIDQDDVYFYAGKDDPPPGRTETLADLSTIIGQIGAVVPTPVSTITVSPSRTWYMGASLEDDRAPQIPTLTAGASVTLAMDFSETLNPDTSITSVAVVETTAHSLTIANELVSQDRRVIHFDVSGLTSGLTYSIRATATTTDSQVLTARGSFVVA